MADFVHLHLHTEYSLLDGACRIKNGDSSPLFERLAEIGQTAAAITDHGVMFGAVEFYKAAKKAGIKPIIGCEVYVAARTRLDRQYELDSESRHLVLLVKNEEGYKNLIKLVSTGFTEGLYIKPRVDNELLRKYSGGLIALSACIAGEIPKRLLAGGYESAKEAALEYLDIFGEGNFYLELQDHGMPEQREVNAGLIRMSEETGIPLVATNDAHYVRREDAATQDALLCIQTARLISDEDRMRFPSDEFYVKSAEEMAALFPRHPEALENTVKIAEKCSYDFEFGRYHLPAFHLPEGRESREYLSELAHQGFKRRFPDEPPEYLERLENELSMIERMGFSDYFLIVSDFITFARSKGIPVGPGRGSAAGSLVSYSLGITDVNPIRYSLVFERFLNPERVSMPDIDIDFCYVRRQEVIDYVVSKYGEDRVAQIVTYNTMAARAVIRDVGRVMGLTYAEVDAVAKQVPFEIGMTLEKALAASERLRTMYENDPKVKALIEMAMALEGMPRNTGTHAAGVVITEAPVYEYVPLAKSRDTLVTQFTMGTLESLGLLKMDFLGLRTLTVIDDAIKQIRRAVPDFDITLIPEDDAETFAMLSQGRTSGVFQIESEGMTNVVTGLKPRSIEDITAVVALFRPGPMQYIPKYIESRHNPSKISYRHPLLEPVLSVTYGCIVYQEQVMEIFRRLAGYSLGKADMVRRAMSKKKMKELEKERINFIDGNEAEGIAGAVKNGVDRATAGIIFDEIMDFANYAFNKAHAVSYAIISYRTAYLKCHYPGEFMAALLTSVLDSTPKIAGYIADCRDMGIEVLPPDINLSEASFTFANGVIRFALVAVKNIGRGFVERIVSERRQNGPFLSLFDFCRRMSGEEMNRRAVENLIKSGAFDCTGAARAQMLEGLPLILSSIADSLRKNVEGQMGFFDMGEDETSDEGLPDVPEAGLKELLAQEREVTGLYLSGHPMAEYEPIARRAGAVPIGKLVEQSAPDEEDASEISRADMLDGTYVTAAGIIDGVKLKTTRSGSMMATMTIEDMTGQIEMLAFSKQITEAGAYMAPGAAVFVRARVSAREDETPKLICEDVQPINEYGLEAIRNARLRTGERRSEWQTAEKQPPAAEKQPDTAENRAADKKIKVYIQVRENDERMRRIKAAANMFPGKSELIAVYRSGGRRFAAQIALIDADKRLTDDLADVLGSENVAVAEK